jgi:hypothetical protein
MITRGRQRLVSKSLRKNHRSKTVSLRLNQNVNHGAILIDSPPQIMLHPVDLEEDFIQKPFVAPPGPSPLQLAA